MPLLKQKATELVPEGYYNSTLLAVNTAVGPNESEYLQWEFELDAYENEAGEMVEGRNLRANSSFAFGPKSKARPWVENISGKKLAPNAEVDTDHLIGKRALLNVVHAPGKEEGTTFAQVKDVMKPLPTK